MEHNKFCTINNNTEIILFESKELLPDICIFKHGYTPTRKKKKTKKETIFLKI